MQLTDSHCHLDDDRYAEDLDAVLERAAQAGVNRILCIGTGDGPPELDRAIRLAERYPQILATIGVHPNDASKITLDTFSDLRALGVHPKVVAFGEIGLDYHHDFSPRGLQREVFFEQLKIARELELPVTIHTREAWDDTMAVLGAHWDGETVIHCFSGDAVQAQQAIDRGYSLAYGGVLTYRNADNVREALKVTPDHLLLVETDAPYLPPLPWRGKRNEPAFMAETVRKLAEVRGATPEHIAAVITANFERLCLRERNATRYTEVSDAN